MNPAELVVLPDRSALIQRVSADVLHSVEHLLASQDVVHLSLTGGTVGIAVLNQIGNEHTAVDWTRVHLWWSDERWLARHDPERNAQQARPGFIDRLPFSLTHVHEMPAPEDGLSLDEAALAYADELRVAGLGVAGLGFDISLLGVGADGHVASLFPDQGRDLEGHQAVLAVRHSPKPPPERLSLSLDAINSSQHVWVAAVGEDKRGAIAATRTLTNDRRLPIALVHGRAETRIYCDVSASPQQ